MIVVTPPAAAARVAVAKPSHSVRPGSLTCTWVSTRPGSSARSPRSTLGRRGVGRASTAAIRPSRTRDARPVVRAVGQHHAGDDTDRRQALTVPPAPDRSNGDLGRVQRAAVQAAQQEAGQRAGGRRLVEDPAGPRGPGSAPSRLDRGGRARRGRTRRWPRTGSAAAPGAGPSPGRSRVPGSAGPAAACSCQAACTAAVSPTGSTLVEPSDRRTPGAGGGHLHHRLGVVGGRMVQALVGGRDAAARRCSRRCRSAGRRSRPCGGGDQPGHGGRAVGAEHRRRGLDLQLEPQPTAPAGRSAAPAARTAAPSPPPGPARSPSAG